MTPPGSALPRLPATAIFLAVSVAFGTPGISQEVAPASPVEVPPYRELWVPTEHLDAVLAKMPRAVMLTPDQYRTLLRDAGRTEKPDDPALEAPVASLVRDVQFEGELNNEVARIRARYAVECFTDEWSEIPLVLPRDRLAHVEVDKETALRVAPPPNGKAPRPVLVVRGKGEHLVTAEFHLPVSRSPAGNAIQLVSPGVAAASMKLTFPDGARLDSSLPFVTGEEDPNVATFVLPARPGQAFEIRWTARNIDAIPEAAVFQTCSYLYSIDSTRVQADLGLVLSSSLAELPSRFEITLPDGVRILSVEGSELLSWDSIATGIEVNLVAGERQAADIRILAEADVTAEADADVAVTLPIADVDGVHRASGTMALIGSDDVRVKNIATGPLTVAAPEALEAAIRDHPDFVAGFRFPVTAGPPEITLSPVRERFNAQLDTRIELKREAIYLTRTLTVIPLEGRMFETEFILPASEELLNIAVAGDGDAAFSWNRIEGNRVRLAWQEGLSAAEAPPALTLASRLDPEGWFELGESPMSLTFTNAVPGAAETVSGYVAVAFDDSFRVETITADGLEARDARTTPVSGTLAWFHLTDYSLELNAARRATEIEAAVTAYALPLQSSLEIEGQLDLEIRYSPISEVVVKLDPAVAGLVRWDSPLLAEKRLDEASGEWTLDFHDEQSGFQRLRFRMALPFEMEESGEETGQKRFAVSAPVFSVPVAKRIRGDWIIEANTDTELTFDANGVDSVDSLRVPAVAGYRPRHRVIAAYRFRGDAYDLEIAGTRHAPEELVTTVVDSLRIDTVISTDGPDRHQARLSLRTSGEQFLEVALPEGAVVWTLTVDGQAAKPVSVKDAPDTLRVQLPAHEDASRRSIALKLIYQTPGRKWGGSGRETVEPIRLVERIPVMRSDWFLHLPEGFDYQRFKSNLRESFEVIDRTLLGQVWQERDRFLPVSGFGVQNEARGWTNYSPLNWGDDVPEAASRHVVRLQERVAKADEAALRADRLRSDGDFAGAIAEYQAALDLIPPAPMTRGRFESYLKRFSDASVKLARQRADEAEYEAAGNLLESVLSPGVDPDNFEAKRLLEQLDDPEYYAPAATPGHLQRARRVEEAHRKARGYVELGDYDAAEREYWSVINQDRYNVAARRSLEEIERHRMDYYRHSRNHTRAEFLRRVAEGWDLPADAGNESDIEFMLTELGAKEARKNGPPADPAAPMAFADSPAPASVAAATQPGQLPTRVYRVPPTFLSSAPGGDGGAGAAAADPFAAPAPSERPGGVSARRTARDILEQYGVNFGPGASATYDPQTGQLIVRNNEEQLDLIGAATESLGTGPPAGDPFPGETTAGGPLGDLMIDSESGESVALGNDLVRTNAPDPSDEINTAIREIVIPDFTIENKSLPEAIHLLNEMAEKETQQPGGFPSSPPVEMGFGDGVVSDTLISLKLRNVPLAEALRSLTAATGTEYQVTASGVVIAAPGTLPADSLETLVLELPNSAFETSDGNGGVRRMSARNLLTAAGIDFPPGTSAAYNRTTGRLAVRNTPSNVQSVRDLFASQAGIPAALDGGAFATIGHGGRSDDLLASAQALGLKGFDFRHAGLIPLDFELPQSGRSYSFAGLYAPEPIRFRYVNWERQIRFAWFWILVGVLVFWLGAVRKWKRPVVIGILGIIVLTFVPLIISQSLLAFCNSLLIGWLLGAGLWLAWQLRMACSRCCSSARDSQEDAGEEVAATA